MRIHWNNRRYRQINGVQGHRGAEELVRRLFFASFYLKVKGLQNFDCDSHVTKIIMPHMCNGRKSRRPNENDDCDGFPLHDGYALVGGCMGDKLGKIRGQGWLWDKHAHLRSLLARTAEQYFVKIVKRCHDPD